VVAILAIALPAMAASSVHYDPCVTISANGVTGGNQASGDIAEYYDNCTWVDVRSMRYVDASTLTWRTAYDYDTDPYSDSIVRTGYGVDWTYDRANLGYTHAWYLYN
jgi:hypothetical protein